MPYVSLKEPTLELTTVGKIYFPKTLQTHFCRKCKHKFENYSTVGRKARLCADCMMDHYVNNHTMEEF